MIILLKVLEIIVTIFFYFLMLNKLGSKFSNLIDIILIGILYLIVLQLFLYIDKRLSYRKQEKQPIRLVKAKVIKKEYAKPSYDITEEVSFPYESPAEILFILNNKTKINLSASLEQYKAVKKNDTVLLIYQGKILHAVKRGNDKDFIYNEGWGSKVKIKDFLSNLK